MSIRKALCQITANLLSNFFMKKKDYKKIVIYLDIEKSQNNKLCEIFIFQNGMKIGPSWI